MIELFKNKNYSYFRATTCQIRMNKIIDYLKKEYSKVIVWLFVPVVVITSFSHHRWVNPESIFEWDVKSYYAYLPAAFIHKDLALDFIAENPKEYGKWFWPVTTPTGKKCIVTSMGQSFLYAPFFFIAHGIAKVSPAHVADGYTEPYAFAIHFSTLFYFILGMFFLQRLLLRYFEQRAVFLTLIFIFLGTNLFYYTAFIAPMTHAPGFALISIFLFYCDSWHRKQTIGNTILIGFLSGLITLIRPTNILVLLVFFFWDTFSLKSILQRATFFIRNYKKVLLMVLFFFIVWTPQFIYWKFVSGKFLFFSYGDLGASFFWSNPQFGNILFSFRKGWWVYTPLMLIASLSIFLLLKGRKTKFLAVFIFLIANIYVQASWWCWWFGGSFGLRAFIDSYGILAIPLAALVEYSFQLKKKGIVILSLLSVLTFYNLFQTKQFNHQAIHYWWMSRTGYWLNFLKISPVNGYWETVPVPDYQKARKGVYVAEYLIDRKINYKGFKLEPSLIVEEIKKGIEVDKHINKFASRFNISVDSAINIEAYNLYETKRNLRPYLKPVLAKQLTDSILKDEDLISTYGLHIIVDSNSSRSDLYNQVFKEINTKDIDVK